MVWPFRILIWYYRRSYIGYSLLLLLACCIGFMPNAPEIRFLAPFLIPWTLLGLLFLNLPFVAAVGRRLTLSERARQNHALEHGTIHFLNQRYERTRRLGGSAEREGFRLIGAKHAQDIHEAFNQLISLPLEEMQKVIVQQKCGSRIIVAQGLGICLLLVTTLALWIFKPEPIIVVLLLVSQLLLFLVLRRPLGNWLQRASLLSTDFSAAKISSIRKVRAKKHFERAPVYFVRTMIESKEP
jgi:hypothetical protein